MSALLLSAIGSKVWVYLGPESSDVYLSGEVVESSVTDDNGEKFCKVVVADGSTHLVKHSDLKHVHPSSEMGVSDILQLSDYGPESLLSSLRTRYMRDEIYTFVGPILVSINPYKWLTEQLGTEVMKSYHGRPTGEMQQFPHIFCTAESAYRNLVTSRSGASSGRNQAIIISGESGAGKTEATKLVMKYLAQVTVSENSEKAKEQGTRKSRKKRKEKTTNGDEPPRRTLEQRVLDTNPLLEAFGNAKTLRNDNSSRFGKFIQIQFCNAGKIRGARVINYLLEKSRIIHQASGERNYHIFYQLLAGASNDTRSRLHLSKMERYRYLSASDCYRVKGIDDKPLFRRTVDCLASIGITEAEQTQVLETVASVLHIGNIRFEAAAKEVDGCHINHDAVCDESEEFDEQGYDSAYNDSSGCEYSEYAETSDSEVESTLKLPKEQLPEAQIVAQLCGLEVQGLEDALCSRLVTIAGDGIKKPIRAFDAENRRDALARALYALLFRWLVKRLNERIHSRDHLNFIGVLDIYGFEQFQVNSFEQFCINYANEKLQQHFNRHIFEVEQAEYEREGIDWSRIEFNNNQACLDLIEKSPLSITSLLDEECLMPQGSDASLLLKLHKQFGGDMGKSQSRHAVKKVAGQTNLSHPYYVYPRFRNDSNFGVKHYAGQVFYSVDGFLRKNNDMLSEELSTLMSSSKSKWIRSLFAVTSSKPAAVHSRTRSNSSLRPPTVSQQFKRQLQSLMDKLEECTPHYVRCIKPNSRKQPDQLDGGKSLEQLRYAGMFETIRIRNQGYALREAHSDFFNRYRVLAPSTQNCRQLVEALSKVLAPSGESKVPQAQAQWQMGHTKVFLRKEISNVLESVARIRISVACRVLQRNYKRYRQRKRQNAVLLLQRNWRMFREQLRLACVISSLTTIQKLARGLLARNAYQNLQLLRSESCRRVQRCVRAMWLRETISTRIHEKQLKLIEQQKRQVCEEENRQLQNNKQQQENAKGEILHSSQTLNASNASEDEASFPIENQSNLLSEQVTSKAATTECTPGRAVAQGTVELANNEHIHAIQQADLQKSIREAVAAAVTNISESQHEDSETVLQLRNEVSDLRTQIKLLKETTQEAISSKMAKDTEISSLQQILSSMRREMTKTEQQLEHTVKQRSMLEQHHKSVSNRERQVLLKLEKLYSMTMNHFGLEDFDGASPAQAAESAEGNTISGIRRLENVVDKLVLGLQFGFKLGGGQVNQKEVVRRASTGDASMMETHETKLQREAQDTRQQQMITTLMRENVQLMDEVIDSRDNFQSLHDALSEAQQRICSAETANATLCSLLAWRDDQLLALYALDANDATEANERVKRLGEQVSHVSEAIHALAPYFRVVAAQQIPGELPPNEGKVDEPVAGKANVKAIDPPVIPVTDKKEHRIA